MRLLIADDEASNRLLLKGLLRKSGHVVIEAQNGREAVEMFAEERPDMVFMDVMMPEMDGYEATERIKALAGERWIPVIFLTALSDEAGLARCIECGGDDFLTKPYSPVLLGARMNSHLRRSDPRSRMNRH